MRAALLILVLVASGCASSRPAHPPGTLEPPTTLRGVNDVLMGTRATVHFTDGREPETAFVVVGIDQTLLRPLDADPSDPALTIPTDRIAFIEVDDSQSASWGAWRGAGSGAIPGVATLGAGLALSAVEQEPNGFYILTPGQSLALLGAAALVIGPPLGALIGAASTARRYPVIVYKGPVTRYPDASARASSRPTRSILELATSD